jgi:hypothetical protein
MCSPDGSPLLFLFSGKVEGKDLVTLRREENEKTSMENKGKDRVREKRKVEERHQEEEDGGEEKKQTKDTAEKKDNQTTNESEKKKMGTDLTTQQPTFKIKRKFSTNCEARPRYGKYSDGDPLLAIQLNDYISAWLFPGGEKRYQYDKLYSVGGVCKIIQGIPKKGEALQDLPKIFRADHDGGNSSSSGSSESLKLAKTTWKKIDKEHTAYFRLDLEPGLSLWIHGQKCDSCCIPDVIHVITF